MKAIILAGGLGTRLGKYTENLPKCMLNFLGKTLIERQVETFRKCGVEEIIIVRKHLAEKIQIPGVKYIDETDYETHMVVGLFEARKEFNEDIILAYGDVLFEANVLKRLIEEESEVGVVADSDWKEYWDFRMGSWTEDSESFIIGEGAKLISLGKPNPPKEEMDARYVGLIKFSKKALKKIEEVYDIAAKDFWEKPWHTSKSFKKAYMTDFIQELIDKKINVRAVLISKGWLEFDTVEDYEKTIELSKEGKLSKFFNI